MEEQRGNYACLGLPGNHICLGLFDSLGACCFVQQASLSATRETVTSASNRAPQFWKASQTSGLARIWGSFACEHQKRYDQYSGNAATKPPIRLPPRGNPRKIMRPVKQRCLSLCCLAQDSRRPEQNKAESGQILASCWCGLCCSWRGPRLRALYIS